MQAQGVIASLSVHGSGDRPSWSGSHGKCHSSLFVPLQFQCQTPSQTDDKQPLTRRDGSRNGVIATASPTLPVSLHPPIPVTSTLSNQCQTSVRNKHRDQARWLAQNAGSRSLRRGSVGLRLRRYAWFPGLWVSDHPRIGPVAGHGGLWPVLSLWCPLRLASSVASMSVGAIG